MQISIPQSDLADVVSLARSVAKSGTGTDHGNILDHILIEADATGRLTVTATDSLRMVIRRTIQCAVLVPGAVVVNASRMAEALGVFPKSVISISVNPENNHTTLSCAGIVLMLRSLSAGDYPKTHFADDQEGAEVEVQPLADLVDRMSYAPSTKPEHAGSAFGHAVLQSDGNRVTMVGFRETMGARVSSNFAFPVCDIMIPRQGLEEMVRVSKAIGAKVSIAIAGGHLTLRGAGVTLSIRLGDMPRLPNVIDSPLATPTLFAVFGREALLSGLKATRASMGVDNLAKIALTENQMKMSSRNENYGSSVELTVKAEYAGDTLLFGAAVDPLIAMLSHFTQDPFISIGFVERKPEVGTGPSTASMIYMCAGSKFDRSGDTGLFAPAVNR